MPTIADLLRNPEFRKLPRGAQLIGLRETDSEFGKLPDGAQLAALDDPDFLPAVDPKPPVLPGRDLREGKRKTTITEDIAQSYKGTIGEAIAPEAARKTADYAARFVGATGEGIASIATNLGNIVHALGSVTGFDTLRDAGGGLASVGKTVEREFKPEKTGGEGVMGQLPEIAGSAVGSMLGFRGVGTLVGKAVEKIAGAGKAGAIANWLATSAVETGTSAGGVYEEELQAGKDAGTAAGSAAKFAAISGPMTAGLNKLGQFNDRIRNPIVKLLGDLGGEIAQEDSEQITQNMVTGKPWNAGVAESTVGAVFGSLIGGSAFEHAAVTGIVNDYHEAVKEHGASPETARQVMERRLTEEAPHTAALTSTVRDGKFDPLAEMTGVLQGRKQERDAAVSEFLAEHPEYREEVLGKDGAEPAADLAGALPYTPAGEATADAPVEAPVVTSAAEALPPEVTPDNRSIGSGEQSTSSQSRLDTVSDPDPKASAVASDQGTDSRMSGKNETPAPADARIDSSAQSDNRTDAEEMYRQAVDAVRSNGKASTGFLQRNFGLKYSTAKQLLERMEAEGIVGPAKGADPREVLPFTPPAEASPKSNQPVKEVPAPFSPIKSGYRNGKPEVRPLRPPKKNGDVIPFAARASQEEAQEATLAEVAAEVKPTLPKLKQRPFAEAVETHGRWEAKLLAAREEGKSTAFIGKMVDKHAAVLRKHLGEKYAGPLTSEEILKAAGAAQGTDVNQGSTVDPQSVSPQSVSPAARQADDVKQRQLHAQKLRDQFATVWEVPPDVWADAAGEFDGDGRKRLLAEHRENVEQAVAAGKPVPAAVLKAHGISAATANVVEKPVENPEKSTSPASEIPRPPTEAEVRRLPKVPRPRTKKAIAEADAKSHADQMGLAGGFYTSYGGRVDEILGVEEGPLSGGYTYTVRDTKTGEVRKHSTRIDPRAVVFRDSDPEGDGPKPVSARRKETSGGVASADLLTSPVLRGVELLGAGVRTFREWKARLVEEYGPSIKHKAYSLWAAAKRLWNDETGTLRLDKLAEWYRDSTVKAGIDYFKPIGRRISEQGDGAGAQLMRLLGRASDHGEVLAGMLLVKLRDAKISKLTREERFQMLDALEGRLSPDKLSDKVREVYTAARAISDELAAIATDLDVQVMTSSGARSFRQRSDYFPHVIRSTEALKSGPVRRDVLENLVRTKEAADAKEAETMLDNFIHGVEHGRWDNRILEYLIKTGQAGGRAEALKLLRQMRTTIRKHGSLEHSREVRLPFYDPDPARVLPWVASTSAIRLAQIAEFGQKGERINAEILKIRDAGGNETWVREQVQRILGLAMDEDTEEKKLSLFLRTLMSFKLGLAQIPNATQGALNTMLAGDFPALAAGVRGMLTKEGRRFAIESGAALDSVLAEAGRDLGEKRAVEAFLKWTGFTAAEQMNRVFAANAGADIARRLFTRVQKLQETGKYKVNSWERQKLQNDFGIDVDEALQRGSLSKGEILLAAKKFSDMTQFRTRVQDQPAAASYKVMWQFKSFAYNQGRLVAKEVIGEWRRGNPGRAMRAMLVLGVFFPLVGDLVRALRDLIKGRDREFESGFARYAAAFSEVGSFGMIADAIRSAGARRGLEFVAGPSISDLTSVAEDLASDKPVDEKMEALRKYATRRLIPFGQAIFERGN